MPQVIKIDFISDISCPWCAIALMSLEVALDRLSDAIAAEITMQPFELISAMSPEGEGVLQYITGEYGCNGSRADACRDTIRARAREVGFEIKTLDRRRMCNTFDAHRLLYWAKLKRCQLALGHVLVAGYFERAWNVADHDVLVAAAESVGLDQMAARIVLNLGHYAGEVRELEAYWRSRDIRSIPTLIVNDRYPITGSLPIDGYECALREIAEHG